MKIKLVATDLDKTLLINEKSTSDFTLKTLKKLKTHNIKFCIVTARPPRIVFDYLSLPLENIYVICLNGAEIYFDKKKIFEKYIEKDEVISIIKKLSQNNTDVKISFESDNTLYTNFELSNYLDYKVKYTKVNFNNFKFKPVAKIIIKINKFDNLEIFNQFSDYNVDITDQNTFVQITHKHTGKLNSLKFVADQLGINLSEIISFGDDINDFNMIKHCGIGVAMKNGEKSVKDIADIIAPAYNQNGVAKVLIKLLSI
ncbi:MAG: Cof-type HAD-IIB family hydrolase [Clostridiales bacterium]